MKKQIGVLMMVFLLVIGLCAGCKTSRSPLEETAALIGTGKSSLLDKVSQIQPDWEWEQVVACLGEADSMVDATTFMCLYYKVDEATVLGVVEQYVADELCVYLYDVGLGERLILLGKGEYGVLQGSLDEMGYPTKSTTTTTGTVTTTEKENTAYKDPYITVETLKDYEKTIKKFTDVDTVYALFKDVVVDREYTVEQEDFAMLWEDEYFLTPQLPAGYRIYQARLHYYGAVSFSIQLPLQGQEFVSVSCDLHKTVTVEPYVEDCTTLTFANSRGMTVTNEYIRDEETGIQYGRYWWKEGDYLVTMPYSRSYTEPYDERYETLLKGLAFKKVSLT